ncbi:MULTISPECIES: ABC transporter ATP-binding protein [Clostridia]|uniref:ABC transporter ATP-binding protein n=1 Tax=Ruminococcus hominis TaxID=2763065 RepID=A0ABR7G781_9FIRM|nr:MULTISPECIES: ABC transporter ATP-binding protein [Clostridia]MBC5682606.1 ABC transporter ATP-binding protein [Ruminococcus hominis]RHV01888.1 ABC transporter ATP-binding protein [Firmicutes bacterium OM07-11]RKQ23777.1 ATP-binding cassette domain-containing protein [Ruminococcus sp. B05]TAP31492.1 ABC transporter ATP-binding protein [Mediterraneibacter sp. gm002]
MRKLLIYLKDYKKESIIGPLFKLLEATFELIVPVIMAHIIDIGIKNHDTLYIWKMGAVLVIFGILGLTCSLLAQYFAAKAAVGFGTALRHDLFWHIENLSHAEVDKAGSSTLVVRMTSDVNQVQSGVNLVLRLFLRSPFIVVGALVMAFTINWKAAMVFVVTVPLLAFVIYGIMVITIPLYKKVQRELDEVLLTTRENLTGVRVIRAFRTQKLERETFEHKSDMLMDIQMHVGKISASLNPLTYIIVNAGIIAVIWFGGIQVNVGDMTQGEVIALVNYMTQTLLALVALANLIITFTKALASAGRINEVFAMKPGIVDGNEKESAVQQTEEPKTAVSMEDVTFYYQESKEPALEHISFTAKKGETIGIIGGTGSGKSTLVSLIPRFYDVTEGRVFVNEKDVREYKVENLRSKVGTVPQKAVLFHGTIRDNMKMGREDASDEEIFEALKTAQALEIVENKPGKLDTVLSEGGKNLSGGQRQRLTIARALVRNPEVLILDDSASALDFATDANLRKAIAEDTNNMTVFIVSQRAASIMHADKIIVLDDGQMVGYGTHQELLKQCEVYQEICYSQFSKEEVQDHE